MTNAELKKAAEEYAPDLPSYNAGGLYIPPTSNQDIRAAFLAGANWQAEQDNYDTIFHKGMMYYRKQMMKEAVEAEISVKFPIVGRSLISVISKLKDFKYGDKVRIIVLPKED